MIWVSFDRERELIRKFLRQYASVNIFRGRNTDIGSRTWLIKFGDILCATVKEGG